MDLRKVFYVGPSEASEAAFEEQEAGNLVDSTPTPTSLEVRAGGNGSSHLLWGFICSQQLLMESH